MNSQSSRTVVLYTLFLLNTIWIVPVEAAQLDDTAGTSTIALEEQFKTLSEERKEIREELRDLRLILSQLETVRAKLDTEEVNLGAGNAAIAKLKVLIEALYSLPSETTISRQNLDVKAYISAYRDLRTAASD